jgi:hypothetical protein
MQFRITRAGRPSLQASLRSLALHSSNCTGPSGSCQPGKRDDCRLAWEIMERKGVIGRDVQCECWPQNRLHKASFEVEQAWFRPSCCDRSLVHVHLLSQTTDQKWTRSKPLPSGFGRIRGKRSRCSLPHPHAHKSLGRSSALSASSSATVACSPNKFLGQGSDFNGSRPPPCGSDGAADNSLRGGTSCARRRCETYSASCMDIRVPPCGISPSRCAFS